MSNMIAQSLLPEFDQEMASTRKTLERVPEDRSEFRPHAKSMTLSRLAGHVAEIPWWAEVTLTGDEFDTATVPQTPAAMTSRQSLLATFDDKVAKARVLLSTVSDADMMRPWSLKHGAKTFFTMPKAIVFRSFVMNHLIHHRAQLGVYLRMNDVPVPSIYGPSADEGNM